MRGFDMTKKCVLLTTADEKNIKYASYTIYTLHKHSPNVIPYVGILNLDNKIIDARQLLKSNPNTLIFDLNDIFKKTIANIEY